METNTDTVAEKMLCDMLEHQRKNVDPNYYTNKFWEEMEYVVKYRQLGILCFTVKKEFTDLMEAYAAQTNTDRDEEIKNLKVAMEMIISMSRPTNPEIFRIAYDVTRK